jgi:hypothetical protein
VCDCPQYSTTIGCTQSYGLVKDVHIVATATRGVLSTDHPVYRGSTTSAGSYAPDCVEAGQAHPACLDFVFSPTVAGVYQVSLALGGQGSLTFTGSEWQVLVSPAELDHAASQPGSFFDFDRSEAGRNNSFYIYPRDRFGNLRDQLPAWQDFMLKDGSDALSLNATGPEFPLGTQGSQFWDPVKHRFEVSQRVTIAGVYTFVVQMGGLESDLVSKPVTVFAAATDVSNTIVELYSQGPNFPAEDGGGPAYLLELKNSGYTNQTSAGECVDLPADNSAQQHALACAQICRDRESCGFFWATTEGQCCPKGGVDPSSSVHTFPASVHGNTYRLVRQAPSPQPPLQPRATYAGATNTFWFTARDTFGNTRANNDTCTVSYSAAPGGDATVSQQWQGGRYVVTFRSSTSLPIPYNVSVSLQTKDKTDGPAAAVTAVPGSPFLVPVWPAALDITKSGEPGPQFLEYADLSTAWLGASVCGSPCRQTVAGRENNFSVIPRDGFGNVQDRHPSIFALQTPDALFVSLACTSPDQADWCDLGASLHPVDTQWDVSVHLYRAQANLNQSPTQMGSYSLVVQLGNAVSLGDDTEWGVRDAATEPFGPVALPLSPVPVFVRPADLSPAHCGSGNGLDPELFHSTEAGRLSYFTVVPRDRFLNIRNQTLFGLSDRVTIAITGGPPQTANDIVWKENAPLWDGTDAPVRPHFATSFQIDQAGDYRLGISIECDPRPDEHREGMRRVELAFVGTLEFVPVTVLPAALDATNTRFLSTFNPMPGGRNAETVGAPPRHASATDLSLLQCLTRAVAALSGDGHQAPADCARSLRQQSRRPDSLGVWVLRRCQRYAHTQPEEFDTFDLQRVLRYACAHPKYCGWLWYPCENIEVCKLGKCGNYPWFLAISISKCSQISSVGQGTRHVIRCSR